MSSIEAENVHNRVGYPEDNSKAPPWFLVVKEQFVLYIPEEAVLKLFPEKTQHNNPFTVEVYCKNINTDRVNYKGVFV